ncbi:MAG: aminotransferase class III-fold pyridoxal phosphate-dependent enzyme [Abditibacteriaceae bacterium]
MNDSSTKVNLTQSNKLYETARHLLPGGTQLLSKRPERFAPGQWPAYYKEAKGCEVVDVDGNHYLDFSSNGIACCALGFADPDVNAAVIEKINNGSMSSLNCPEEVELAQMLIELHPWAHCARYARSGGEALAIAARLARAKTRRDVIAFCGYHGWSDWYLAANLGDNHALDNQLLPGLNALGVPQGLRGTALPFHFNQLDELQAIVREHGHHLAAVIMEPTRHSVPTNEFINGVRDLCDQSGALLVFDEVTTGFHLRSGGYHLNFDIKPDMAVFAKALGNGHPIAAVIGTENAMDAAHESFISSTYWTEGVGFAAAVATLKKMQKVLLPQVLQSTGEQFIQGMNAVATRYQLPLHVSGHPALAHFSFQHPQDLALQTLLTVRMLNHGILMGNGFYPTLAHQQQHLDKCFDALDIVFAELKEALDTGDVEARIGGPIKQSGFARLS